MCGVFGFVAKGRGRLDLRQLQAIAAATEARGPDAFGFAWIDAAGRLKMYKQTGPVSRSLDALAMAADARLLIGHCRFATHGTAANNLNNHPHPVDGGWLVHNGVIHRHRAIARAWGLAPVTECDSETLGLLIEQLDGSLVERTIAAAQLCKSGPLALLALWRSPAQLVAVKSGNPLHRAETRSGTYLASLAAGMPRGVVPVPEESALVFGLSRGRRRIAFDMAGCP